MLSTSKATLGRRGDGSATAAAWDEKRALAERGRELAGYNADLAYANAMADVRKLEADIREADRIGKSTGSLTDTMSRFDTAKQTVATEIEASLSKVLDKFLTPLVPLAEKVADFVEEYGPALEAAAGAFADVPVGAIGSMIDTA